MICKPDELQPDALKLFDEEGLMLLKQSLLAVNPAADVITAIAEVAQAVESYTRDREGLTGDEFLEALHELQSLSWRLGRRVAHAPPQIAEVLFQALEKTKVGNKEGLAELLGEVAGASLAASRHANAQIPLGRPKAGGHLRPLILELARIFEDSTHQPVAISAKRTQKDPGPGWLRATKGNAARRFVEVVIAEGLGEDLEKAQIHATLKSTRKKSVDASAYRKAR